MKFEINRCKSQRQNCSGADNRNLVIRTLLKDVTIPIARARYSRTIAKLSMRHKRQLQAFLYEYSNQTID